MSGFKADPDPRRPALSPLAAQYAADLFDREMEQVHSQFVKKEREIITEFTNRGLQASNLCFNQLALNAIERARRTARAKNDALEAAYRKDGARLDARTLAVIHGEALESFSEFQAQFLRDIQARTKMSGISHGTFTASLIRSYRRRFIGLAAELRRDHRIQMVEASRSTEVEESHQAVVPSEAQAPRSDQHPTAKQLIERRLPPERAAVVLSVFAKLEGSSQEWFVGTQLKQYGIPPSTVFDASRNAVQGRDYRGGGPKTIEYQRAWLLDYVTDRWSPRSRPSGKPDGSSGIS